MPQWFGRGRFRAGHPLSLLLPEAPCPDAEGNYRPRILFSVIVLPASYPTVNRCASEPRFSTLSLDSSIIESIPFGAGQFPAVFDFSA